ncbi:MAG: hypothetical protein ACJ8HI_04210, partial [Massilia sp.]
MLWSPPRPDQFMPPFSLPSSPHLSDPDARRIAFDAAAADADGWLTPRQQALLHRRGWLRMLAPGSAGGLEL